MGKPIVQGRPPSFKPCPFCKREFGSRSLDIHKGKCRDMRRIGDDSDQVSGKVKVIMPETKARRIRPHTAILRKPTILDETLKDKVDMAMTKKQFLAAVKLCTDLATRQKNRVAMDKQRLNVRHIRAPLGYNAETRRLIKVQPKAKTDQANLPNVAKKGNSNKSPRSKAKTKTDEVTKDIPMPCNSCGRSDLPERFHTHPNKDNDGEDTTNSRIPVPQSSSSPAKVKVNSPKKRPVDNDANSRGRRRRRRNSVGVDSINGAATYRSRNMSKSLSPRKSDRRFLLADQPSIDKASDDSDNQLSSSSNVSGGSTGSTINEKKPLSQQQVNCEICGKPFGKVSLKFHLPQCKKKEMLLKEKAERERREAEERQLELERVEEEQRHYHYEQHLDPEMEAMWEAHVQQLVPCEMCGRTFFPERINTHMKSCKGVKVTKRQESITDLMSRVELEEKSVGEKFKDKVIKDSLNH